MTGTIGVRDSGFYAGVMLGWRTWRMQTEPLRLTGVIRSEFAWEAHVHSTATCAVPNTDHAPKDVPVKECQCVLASSMVKPVGAVYKGFRRRYDGPLLRIETRRGHRLTITPGHPVATPHGWIAAHLLKEGDDVISRPRPDPALATDLHQMPTRAEDLYAALHVARPQILAGSIAPAAIDFHGDGKFTEDEVEFVASELHQSVVGNLPRREEFRERVFAGRVGTHDSLRSQSLAQGPMAHADLLGEATTGFSRHVSLDNGGRDSTNHGVAATDAQLAESIRESSRIDTARRGKGIVGLADEVTPDEIVQIRNIESGPTHVYNFSTASGVYVSDGILVHNCGFYAYPDYETLQAASGPWTPLKNTRGVVAGWGKTWVHERGWRTKFARPLALLFWPERRSGITRPYKPDDRPETERWNAAQELIAEIYDVPICRTHEECWQVAEEQLA